MKFRNVAKDMPVELTEAILGDEVFDGDEIPLDIQTIIERATGVSLSPFSQQKIVLSNEAVGTSDRGSIFEDIFGETAQTDFLNSSAAKKSFDLMPALASFEAPSQPQKPLFDRFVDRLKILADNPETPSDLRILTDNGEILAAGRKHNPEVLKRFIAVLEGDFTEVRTEFDDAGFNVQLELSKALKKVKESLNFGKAQA
jgi:hypothetical protein